MPASVSLALKSGRQFPFLSRHPWVHIGSLADDGAGLETGQIVDLVDHEGTWIAQGLVNPHSRLRVRLYTWDREDGFSESWLTERIDRAIARRRLAGPAEPESAERLIFSESDGLSGLVVDRYADYLSVQITSGALNVYREAILSHLQSRLSPRGICLRVDEKTASHEGMEETDTWVAGSAPEGPVWFRQNGLLLSVDLLEGQKTGTYLDQRTNHAAAAAYLRGRRVLDVCCYAGGFGLVAAAAGAAEVIGVDGSAKALEQAAANAQRNAITTMSFVKADCFDYLAAAVQAGEKYDAVILDPPRFAGSRHQIESALRAYQRLNSSAVDLLPPGGVLVTCSCSGRVSRSDFLNMLAAVARRRGRNISILEGRGAGPDHPISVSCPETDYLKCMICEVS
ncbi:MAG: class I SAM-dependent rRNA methyltransferase [Planctomycetaceae bacterium]